MTQYLPHEAGKLVRDILLTSQDVLLRLGASGKGQVRDANVYDIATKGDRSIAHRVMDLLKARNVPAVFCDEELGVEKIVADPCYTIVFDDIDGTNNYHRGRDSLPYCIAVAVFDKPLEDCGFSDVIAAGILEHVSGTFWETIKGSAMVAERIMFRDREGMSVSSAVPVITSGRKNIVKRDTVVAIEGYETGRQVSRFAEIYENAWVKDVSSSAHELAGVACGIYDAFIHPRHKKDEIAAGFLLIKEAGGCLTDFAGNAYDEKKFVYDPKHRYEVVAAATPELNAALRAMIKPA
jgi:fructose-1,6-bisphosphatase/inositol monophosphatase family enzyme